jgi:RHS repeat-associated protein
MNNYTLYPSPFVVMDGNGYYTKHYFAGSERIASRPAGLYTAGATPQPLVKPVEGSTKQLDETAQNQLLRLNQYLKEYKMPEAKFKKASKAEKEKQHLYNILEFEVNNLPNGENKQQALILLAKGDLEILKTLLKVEPTATKKGKHGIDIYYFHPDHLGTATFVSDANGEPYQFFLNLPFGETMAEQRAGSWENSFKFNGKELDQETGLYYYGARYYNPRWSSWLSVDPLADKYPHASPYNYVLNNPIRYIDPDGRQVKCETCPDDSNFNVFRNHEGEWEYDPETGFVIRTDLENDESLIEEKEKTPKGKSSFEITEINIFSAGEGVTGGAGSLEISSTNKTPEILKGKLSSDIGFTLGWGAGLPVEILALIRGQIILDNQHEAGSIEEIFGEVNYITIRSFGVLLKFTRIDGYKDRSMQERVFYSNLFGGGVATFGISGSGSVVKFKLK